MVKVLDNLKTTCRIVKEFYAILSEELAAVTGSRTDIDAVREKVYEQVIKLSNFVNDIFLPENFDDWEASFKNFTNAVDGIEDETIGLINRTFGQNLNSAAGAFDLLDNFNDVETRPKIRSEFEGKYADVLEQYKQELLSMAKLFEDNQQDPPIPKNMPPNSGAIAWARSIIMRVKTPIDRFKTKSAILTGSPLGKEVAKTYVNMAKDMTERYEGNKFTSWKKVKSDEAIRLLKSPILATVDKQTYKVNFDPNLRVIIREAKFLDRIGKEIPHTIVNIALQEKDYMQHIDGLNKLLRSYNSALGDLRAVEKKLLFKDINKL